MIRMIAMWNTFTIAKIKYVTGLGFGRYNIFPPTLPRKKEQSERKCLLQTEKLQSLTTNEWSLLLV
jgi:hypothetical protein